MSHGSITRADLIHALKREVGLSPSDCAEVFEDVLDEIVGCLGRGEPVKLHGFAAFSVRHKKACMGRNPRTGEEAPILPRRVVKFCPSGKLKLKVNTSSQMTKATLDD